MPEENQNVSKVFTTRLLREAFNFIPGVKMNFTSSRTGVHPSSVGATTGESWEVFTDAYNQAYIYCHTTKSSAYFVNNDTLHFFTDFIGDRNSLLYYFYLAAHKILLGYYQGMKIEDRLPISNFYSGVSKVIQDFIAPFYIYLKADYKMTFSKIDDIMNPGQIEIRSSVTAKAGETVSRAIDFVLVVKENKISSFTIREEDKTITAECIG